MNWLTVKEIDWNRVFDNGISIVVYGGRNSLMDNLFQNEPVKDYACGHIHTMDDKGFILESFVQGEASFEFDNVVRVAYLEET